LYVFDFFLLLVWSREFSVEPKGPVDLVFGACNSFGPPYKRTEDEYREKLQRSSKRERKEEIEVANHVTS